MDLSDIDLRDAVEHVPDLVGLFSSAWWTADRDAAGVARMLAGSDLVVALVHRPQGGWSGSRGS